MSKREQSWSHSLKPGNNDRLGHFPFVQPYEYNPKGNAQSQKNNNCNNNFRTSVPRFCERGCCSSSKGARGAVQGGRGRKRGRCFLSQNTGQFTRPLLEEGGESHFYTNFRRSVCVCGQKWPHGEHVTWTVTLFLKSPVICLFFTDQLVTEGGKKLTAYATNMSLYGNDHECVRLL